MVRNAQTGSLEMFHEITFCHDWPARLQALHRAAVAAHESYCELESLVPSEFGPPPAGTRHETVQLAAAAWFQVSAISDAGCLALAEWQADTEGDGFYLGSEAKVDCWFCDNPSTGVYTSPADITYPVCERHKEG